MDQHPEKVTWRIQLKGVFNYVLIRWKQDRTILIGQRLEHLFENSPEPIIALATSSESAFEDSEIFAAAEAFLKVPPTVIDLELAPALFFLSPPIVFILRILHDTMPASFNLLQMGFQLIHWSISALVQSNYRYVSMSQSELWFGNPPYSNFEAIFPKSEQDLLHY